MIAVILLIAFLITGCEDKSAKTDHIIRIGVVTYTQDDPFINAMTDQLKENLKKMETDHMKIITTVKNGDDNQQDQNEIVEEMIDAGCDVLCVNLVDRRHHPALSGWQNKKTSQSSFLTGNRSGRI